MNCRKAVGQKDAKFFDGVFLCPNCEAIARRVEERLGNELRMMQTMLHESIRVACCEGRLHLSESVATKDVSKKEVLEAIVQLSAMKEVRKQGEG